MFRNYLTIAFRNLTRNKVYSFINIGGLAVGMAVAMLIGLWMWDELSFDTYHKNHDRIAKVMQHISNNGEVQTRESVPYPLAEELRKTYGSDFKHVVLCESDVWNVLSYGNNKFLKIGNYFEPEGIEMLGVNILKGSRKGLNDPYSIMLSASVAKALFGNTDPINKIIKMDNQYAVKVTGVYEDFPSNSSFHSVSFIAPYKLFYNRYTWVKTMYDPWRANAFQIYVQIADKADFDKVSFRIKDAKLKKVNAELAKLKPTLFLQPMSKWHLYSEFKDGFNIGGRIQYVWLFGIIGIFVLLLACINFMNLSTARSEKRAKEVGVRKAIGSARSQLISQFFSESFLVVTLAFILCLFLVQLCLPFFNELADKNINILWTNPLFWLAGISFSLFTGLIAGTYPAFYLSSFQPVKVLKGSFRVGRFASMPRKVLVVMQFTVSITLIIGTIVIFRQIQYAKNRPIGYETNGLVSLPQAINEIHKHFDVVKDELLKTGAVISLCETSAPTTENWSSSTEFNWPGKDPNILAEIPNIGISYDYGKTIGWQMKEGRDFSKSFSSDSTALILNESAVKLMGLAQPIGKTISWFQQPFTVIGVVKDVIIQSPYEPVKPTVYTFTKDDVAYILAKINPEISATVALSRIESVFKKYNPSQPFDYNFVDEEYAKKFDNEERISKLATFFAILAIFISCLGLFGLASFVAEQRTKEIGIRKVLGATVFNLWQLLSKDFVVLVLLAFLIATPLSYYFMNNWIQNYAYHTNISWWIFAVTGLGALLITLLTVSFQSIKSALMNPVKSLRTE
ncbi:MULTISPECIES: ABC transporter permease [unclassified Arcicella]|uniref:ABC transporter permease n=1 Tax=unclassified Arcicella TaxID=2644986 RepID=UPI0028640914|nr:MULTISPECIES: ABC transporter permease [unclassified Arcicella]MDR6563866.1 ABC-type antimicrobial peptide transport system permease subunit [Arcicella sp. BE51]MDR6813619.1 ABC-type antimicrobial peptide transport system permease subunit [Arcicella sp. BE140]MDR6825000.1 ABC-type antimicrobial peptide transport system permease subunit [Arcicella sp. BE139]